ncbi:MAG: hypothetical protein KGL39_55575 [Patescibacteria group bacterium]|nr:hypothetical protein [Patescibacteria group bacterium]
MLKKLVKFYIDIPECGLTETSSEWPWTATSHAPTQSPIPGYKRYSFGVRMPCAEVEYIGEAGKLLEIDTNQGTKPEETKP